MRIEAAARAAEVALTWRPFLLGPIFKAQGWNDSPFNIYPVKGRYMWRDLERVCAAQGIPWQRPSSFPRNGLLAARVACRFAAQPWVSEFVRRVYAANFAEDRDIADRSVIAGILESLGRQPADVLGAAESADARAQLRTTTEQAQALGIFGAPTFVVGTELFWGNDRLEAAIEWAQRR
ncbi:2-hydroxychromene-2-carboxylate isomerase [Candidatus Binatia bacterium]|nr:2-hydroxychromene-2-carboxylate isomerase [Candidatus Binatia bacterium]